jgi:hypothetical protein
MLVLKQLRIRRVPWTNIFFIKWETQINLKPGRVIIIKLAAHSAVYNLEMFPINNGVGYPASCMFLKPSSCLNSFINALPFAMAMIQ